MSRKVDVLGHGSRDGLQEVSADGGIQSPRIRFPAATVLDEKFGCAGSHQGGATPSPQAVGAEERSIIAGETDEFAKAVSEHVR